MFYCSGTVIGEWTAGVPAGEQKPKDGAQKTNRYTHGERERDGDQCWRTEQIVKLL